MSWKILKISDFLKERKDRFKPAEANKLGLKRIEKIDFSGNVHIVEKQTNTGMILVKNGDLVISGINVEKGALAVYEGQEDILATIHYSSYEYDNNKINIEYLKWFLKSNVFRNILLEQVGGGIKTELKPKRFLPLEVYLPDLPTQVEIKNKILAVEQEINEVENRINQEQTYLTKLKEAILQEAVQGKLVEQNPNDEPASILLEKIKKEKEQLIKEKKIKKEKPLPEITQDEIPYELPNGWEWVRINDISILKAGGDVPKGSFSKEKSEKYTVPIFANGEKNKGLFGYTDKPTVIEKSITISGRGTIGYSEIREEPFYPIVRLIIVTPFTNLININYLHTVIRSIDFKNTGTSIPQLTVPMVKNKYLIPLPPLEEQKRIVEKVDILMAFCDELEQEINKSKLKAEQLMQSVLKEAFEQKEELLVEN